MGRLICGFADIFYRNTLASELSLRSVPLWVPVRRSGLFAGFDGLYFHGKRFQLCLHHRTPGSQVRARQEVTDDELGGAVAAQRKAGVCSRSENSEEECIANIKELLSYLPQNNMEELIR
jgi:hypothetical protein